MRNSQSKSIEWVIKRLEEMGICTIDEVNLVTNINGYNMDSINDIIYVRTGYTTYEKLLEDKE